MNSMRVELEKESPDKEFIDIHQRTIEPMILELEKTVNRILDEMLVQDCSVDDWVQEREDMDFVHSEMVQINIASDKAFAKGDLTLSSNYGTARSESGSVSSGTKHRFKLPKIQMKKFNGELTEWLGWWAQYSKIDEDETIHTSDKFQYLIQSITPGTRAMDLVQSYPMTEENYPKVLRALRQRFAKKKILKQVYVRELLKMVMTNVQPGKKIILSKMYDSLESHLRSLEELGVTAEQTAEFLYPMVESSLPEDLLVAWQRSPLYGIDGSKFEPPTTEMDHLMKFLQREVEIESQRELVRSGFQEMEHKDKKSNQSRNKKNNEGDCATAAGLFSSTEADTCVFCDKNHPSNDCFKAQKMTLKDKSVKVKDKKACYGCLRRGHFTKNCKTKVQCIICHSKKHVSIMCPEKNKSTSEKTESSEVAVAMTNSHCTAKVLLQTLLVRIRGAGGRERVARVILDNGSQGTCVRRELTKNLHLKSQGSVSFRNSLYGGQLTEPKTRNRFKLCLMSMNRKVEKELIALDEPTICGQIGRIPYGPWIQELANNNVRLDDFESENAEIEILIGSDYYGQIQTGRIIHLDCGLTAFETIFGWTLGGRLPCGEDSYGMLSLNVSLLACQASLSEVWSLELLGIKDLADVKTKSEREQATKLHFQETVSRDQEGRYSVRLPWMLEFPKIPDNKTVAYKRLESTTKKLEQAKMYEEYNKIFQQWLDNGIIEVVSEECKVIGRGLHYLPHHPVFRPDSLTTPVRPVFDASCKVGRNPSLNECLEKGPNLLEQIPSILLRFREKRIGAVSDIKKAFLMIQIDEGDRDYLRFLWWEDPSHKTLKIYRHRRVVFGVNCSPFLLGAVLELHLKAADEQHKEVADKLLKSFYVDNSVVSVDSMEEYKIFKSTAISLLMSAKMDLCQWEHSAGDNPGVGLPSGECGLGLGSVCAPQELVSVLGYKWNTRDDTIRIGIPQEDLPQEVTKRVVLSMVQQVFDPMGFLCPATLTPKVILQKAWAKKTDWDESLAGELKEEFESWWSERLQLEKVHIPRHALLPSFANIEFHVFSDACRYAYAAAVFVRVIDGNKVRVQLLQAKSRVAPIKTVSIPRLELLGCTLAARLAHGVKDALDMTSTSTYFWSDSTTALAWIHRNDEWGTFVGNRVREICLLTDSKDWHFVPGEINPADLPSRGCSPAELITSRWWEGPKWLYGNKADWPNRKPDVNEIEVEQERKGRIQRLLSSTIMTSIPWYVNRFSSYYQNLNVIAYILRVAMICRKREVERGDITVAERDEAERRVIRWVQFESFPASVTKKEIAGLRVETDEQGLIRVQTKIINCEKSEPLFQRPYLLPSIHPMVDQLILEIHVLGSHGGVQFLMGKLRERYWIIRSRRSIRRVLLSCVRCKRYNAKPPTVPQAGLPEDRVSMGHTFQVTGVDLAGPLYLKDRSKTWIVLFTCAVFRCVHLELVDSLSTDAFLLAFHRFISRRGRPSTVYSDNGTNFVGAVNLFKGLDWDKILTETGNRRIQWKLNPPSAAWWGGWWERLVRSLKDLLKRVLGKSRLSHYQLYTCLCEAEAVMNDRPLTYVSEDQDDLSVLKPSMFLRDNSSYDVPECDNVDESLFPETYRSLGKLKEELRQRFRKEYLSQLVQRAKMSRDYPFQLGDVVLIGDDNRKRMDWPMGRIVELFPGRDGEIRVAKVKTATSTIMRPLQRLYPLEVSRPEEELPEVEMTSEETLEDTEPVVPAELISDNNSQQKVCKVVKTRSGRIVKAPSRLGI